MKFNKKDLKTLTNIITSRRDVRDNNFINKKISSKKLDIILHSALQAPSVGYSQPWQFIIVNKDKRDFVYTHFKRSFEKSKKKFVDKPLYSSLKLEGIKESNINIAVYYKKSTSNTLGQTYMKRTGEYSVVCAILNMWLTARALNIGMGWVSILKPKEINKIFDIDKKSINLLLIYALDIQKNFMMNLNLNN